MKFKGAILGLGNIALRSHLPTLVKLGSELDLVAGADKAPENRAAFKRMFPHARVYREAEELLAQEELDFVDICTPPSSHLHFILEASCRGYHILCEKPLCTSLEEAEQIEQAIRKAKVVFLPCHQYRYSPQWSSIFQLIKRGEIGDPEFWQVKVERFRANAGNPHWNPDWRTLRSISGGGIVLDHGSHLFYLGRLLFGDPQQMEAKLSCLRHQEYGIEDTAEVNMQHAQGASLMNMTWAAERRHTEQFLRGSAGEIIVTEEELLLRDLQGNLLEVVSWREGMSEDSAHTSWYEQLMQCFLGCMRTGEVDPGPLEEAVCVMRCAHLTYESARTGRAIAYA